MTRSRLIVVAGSAIAVALAFAACIESSQSSITGTSSAATASASRSSNDDAEVDGVGTRRNRSYGKAERIGNGTVRTYILRDKDLWGTPLEIGVAMSERAMEGLPAPMPMSAGEMKTAGHANMTMYLLELPSKNPTPYRFVQFDWNASGHEPAGVYDLPHFDFHFYTVPQSVRASILPSDPQYAQKAASYPAPEFRAPFYIDAATPAGAPPAAVTVPQMGLHWLDVRSPELQGMTGNPAGFKPFTKTFIYGSWDGQFIFDEPMITRAYILAKKTAADPAVRDEIIPVSVPPQRAKAGFYPGAYRITWDAEAKEYRIALTQLAWRDAGTPQ
jgi:hypothetical protein